GLPLGEEQRRRLRHFDELALRCGGALERGERDCLRSFRMNSGYRIPFFVFASRPEGMGWANEPVLLTLPDREGGASRGDFVLNMSDSIVRGSRVTALIPCIPHIPGVDRHALALEILEKTLESEQIGPRRVFVSGYGKNAREALDLFVRVVG
ncbi:MAG: hypothetical protein HQL31_04705, partial [Planctomycetes bacterium]|nr:hypothetical protein [Planctomycetota bacterium]